MKNAIILYGMPSKEGHYNPSYPSNSNAHFVPWIQRQLILKDILTQTPEMPVPYNPEYSSWKETLEYFPINEETILVGHSCGGGMILRHLSENDIKVGKVVLVAPWIDPNKIYLKTGMFDFEIDKNILDKVESLDIMYSLDDEEDVLETIKILKDRIPGANYHEFTDKGHFCEEDIGLEFPELKKILLD